MVFNRNPKGRIKYPRNRDWVSGHFRAEGSIDRLPAGRHLILAVGVGGLIWPKGEVQIDNTSWAFEVYEGGTPPGGRFKLSLFLVGSKGYDAVTAWLDHGRLTGE
jgi:hypothetical protein